MPHPRLTRGVRTVKFTLAYDGCRFAGWQRQKNARTVSATLEGALSKIFKRGIRVAGAARTDSGVHALGQVASAAIPSSLPLATLKRALNAWLPEDLLVRSVEAAPPGFHARFSATLKHYRYTLFNRRNRPLFERNVVTHVPGPLDLAAMRLAARLLTGRHDFKPFKSAGSQTGSSIRRLSRLSLRSQKGVITIDALGDGFLYHMVRRMVGLLVQIGKGRYPPRVVEELLEGRSPVIPPTAPAKGLCLMEVRYD